jgi:hypothetical protein
VHGVPLYECDRCGSVFGSAANERRFASVLAQGVREPAPTTPWRTTTVTALDGTPIDPTEHGRGLAALAATLRGRPPKLDLGPPLNLAHLEQHVLRTHGAELRRHARAERRWASFAAGRHPYGLKRPPRRGRPSLAYARAELTAERREARPRTRRADRLQRDIIDTVRAWFTARLYRDLYRGEQRGKAALVNDLTARYLRVQCPTLCKGITPSRIRARFND